MIQVSLRDLMYNPEICLPRGTPVRNAKGERGLLGEFQGRDGSGGPLFQVVWPFEVINGEKAGDLSLDLEQKGPDNHGAEIAVWLLAKFAHLDCSSRKPWRVFRAESTLWLCHGSSALWCPWEGAHKPSQEEILESFLSYAFGPAASPWLLNVASGRDPATVVAAVRLQEERSAPAKDKTRLHEAHSILRGFLDTLTDLIAWQTKQLSDLQHAAPREEALTHPGTTMSDTPLAAAGVLLFNGSGHVLVTHRDHNEGFGLPCGGVEPGESGEEAAIRETLEETGYDVETLNVPPFLRESGNGKLTATYLARVRHHETKANEGLGVWMPPSSLLQGVFADYNREMLRHFGVSGLS